MRFLIRLNTPLRLSELVDTLSRAELAVDVPRAPSADQAERELKIYLAFWRAQYPEARADLVRV